MDPLKVSPPQETKLHFLDYWRIIRIRKTVILAVFLLVVITATLVTFILPESYSSTARIKIERDQPDISGLADRPTPIAYDPYFIQTEFEVIQSEVILGKVVADLDLCREWGKKYAVERLKTYEAVDLLKKRIDLRPVRNTSLIEIRVYSDKADEAAKLANAIAEVYREHRQEQRRQLSMGGIKALEQRHEENKAKIQDFQAEMAALSPPQSDQDTIRLAEARRRLEFLQRWDDVLGMKIASEKTDMSLPATMMVEIVDRAVPGLRPVRPNKPLNITIGIIVGGVSGFVLATLVYALQWRAFRRTRNIPYAPLLRRFRAIVYLLSALVLAVVIGYLLANPLHYITVIIIPLALFVGGIAAACIALASLRSAAGGSDGTPVPGSSNKSKT